MERRNLLKGVGLTMAAAAAGPAHAAQPTVTLSPPPKTSGKMLVNRPRAYAVLEELKLDGLIAFNPINVYSFSLAPEEHQPSGSCNFSRVDTTTLVFDSITGVDGKALAAGSFPSTNYPYLFRMYAVNYNIFRVMSGMGGLAYSN